MPFELSMSSPDWSKRPSRQSKQHNKARGPDCLGHTGTPGQLTEWTLEWEGELGRRDWRGELVLEYDSVLKALRQFWKWLKRDKEDQRGPRLMVRRRVITPFVIAGENQEDLNWGGFNRTWCDYWVRNHKVTLGFGLSGWCLSQTAESGGRWWVHSCICLRWLQYTCNALPTPAPP